MFGMTYTLVLLGKLLLSLIVESRTLNQISRYRLIPNIVCRSKAHILLFPKPKYKGPENVTYFLGDEFEKELAKDKKVKWLIEFYATWNPDCNEFAGVFGELSAKYANKNLKFGKIDVARSPKIADKYNIIASVTSRTLPTLILFKDGREYVRRPLIDARDRVVPFSFSFVSIIFIWIVTISNIEKLATNHVIHVTGEHSVSIQSRKDGAIGSASFRRLFPLVVEQIFDSL